MRPWIRSRVVLGALACALAGVACGRAPMPVAPPRRPPPPPVASKVATVDPPPVTEGAITEQTVNGMTILVKRVPGAELVAANLYVRGGARNWGRENAGIEALALASAIFGGTEDLGKDPFVWKMTSMGSEISAWWSNDYTLLTLKAFTPHFDETFELLAAAFMKPALPSSEVERQRQNMLWKLKNQEEDPDVRINLLAHKAIFKGHPYENPVEGTVESLSKLTVDQVKAHLQGLRQGSRLLFVVVGDVDPARVALLVKAKLALPRGDYRETPMPAIAFTQSKVDLVHAPLPTNYILGRFAIPGWRDGDFFASLVAMRHLGFRVWEEVRAKRNLSFAPGAGAAWESGVPVGGLYVTAVDPDTTMKVMFDEVKKLKATPLTAAELAAAKATLLTEHLADSEAMSQQATWLAHAQLFAGDWRFEGRLLERVKAVDAQQVQAFANKYIQHLQFVVLGKSAVDKGLLGSL
jgi:zinc protease